MVTAQIQLLTFDGFWIPVALYALATSASPGPVNIIAAASGVNFGIRQTLPQVMGATLGFSLLLAAVGLGLNALASELTVLHQLLRLFGGAFLCYLAWKLWRTSGTSSQGESRLRRPPSFWDGLLLQWVNPKAWIVAAAGVGAYSVPGEAYLFSVFAMAAVFLVICFPSVGAWAVFGRAARQLMRTGKAVRRFNGLMALLLVASIAILFA